jgi:single-strand DNA-binding protein
MLIGHLGRDPEVRYTPSNVAVVNFSMATSEKWKDKNSGEQKENTEWHNVVGWRRLAEICGEYLHKGSKIYCEGKLQTRSWEDKDENTRYKTEIVMTSMIMLDGKNSGGGSSGRYTESGAPTGGAPSGGGAPTGQPQRQMPGQGPDDDDIPF